MSSASPAFMPGLTLNRRFYWEIVRPLLDKYRPTLKHSAALIGYGADVLGYDTPIAPTTRAYFGRPFQVLFAERFAEAIVETITAPSLRELSAIGAVDQFTDNVAIHSGSGLATKPKHIYHTQ